MPLDAQHAHTFVGLLPQLAPEADVSQARKFFLDHSEACREEFGRVPGFDQVRAGLVRLLPAVVDEAERGPLLDQVEQALGAYAPSDDDGLASVRRHPAWVGLCSLELDEQRGRDEDAVERALALAMKGFAAVERGTSTGEGEVLWALAEAAGEVGWQDRATPLLLAAARAIFEDEGNRARVMLVRILQRLEVDDEDVAEEVEALLALPVVDDQTRVHALWIGAHLDRTHGDVARFVQRLEDALELVDPLEDPDVHGRIVATLGAMTGRGAPLAEA